MIRAFALFVIIALGSCGQSDPVGDEQHTAALPDPVNQGSASPTGAPPPAGAASGTPTRGSAATIPAALIGRWGLSPDDCTAGGETQGLLIVSPGELQVYESRAVPAADVQTSANSISGEFAFTGEGQQWTKHQSLELQKSKLIRTERNPLGTFTYVRCQ